MFVSRKSVWGRTGKVLALALTLALNVACPGEDDDDVDVDSRPDAGVEADAGTYTGGPVTVTGRVTYDFVPATYSPSTRAGTLAFAQAVARPVRGAVVQVRQGSNVLISGNTDEQGNYRLTYTPVTNAAATLVALARTTNPAIQVEDNTDNNAVWAVGVSMPLTATTQNLHAGHGWTGSGYDAARRFAAPFAILDSMYTAARSFMAVRTVTFPELKVNWSPNNVPQSGDKAQGRIGTSHFAFQENQIYILGRSGVDTDEFDSHVIVHEWGHYFEANLSRADSPGGPHTFADRLDPRLSFGEGYGNALAAMILPEPMYVDTLWAGSGTLTAFGFDAETPPSPTDDPTPGVFSESSVMRILYDLYDSGSNESSFDTVGLGLGTLYDVLVGPQKNTDALTTLGSFITGIKEQPGVDAAAVNTLLARYQVGPLTSGFGEGDTSLRAMFTNVSGYPYSTTVTLRGGVAFNKQQQNRYFVFTGTGRTMNISATQASEDVAIQAYRRGTSMGISDRNYFGTESFSFSSQADTRYVLVLTGFKDEAADYSVSVSITSP
jgi:hypothetical protein